MNEVVTLVNIALGELPLSMCPMGDLSQDRAITVDEIVSPMRTALTGCR